jgi:hypothetical protein
LEPLQARLAGQVLARELVDGGAKEERVAAGCVPARLAEGVVNIAREPVGHDSGDGPR